MKELPMKPRTICLAGLASLVLAVVFATMPHVVAQAFPQVLVYGQNSGTPKVINLDTSGRQNVVVLAGNDPCTDPNGSKSSVAVTATGEQVALTGGSIVYVCAFYATLGGTAPTITFQYGTGTNCGTGTTALSGAFAPTVGTELILGHGSTIMKGAASNALCIALAGTSPTVAGILTYVKG